MNFKLKNFTIKEFNNDVNNSGDLDDKYNKWSDYRKTVSEFIAMQANRKKKTKNIIVFGAGECNDIDLSLLIKTFDKVVLTDVDKKSIIEGIKRQKLSDNEIGKIELIQIEYTGLGKTGFFKKFSAMIASELEVSTICKFIKEELNEINQIDNLQGYKNYFDVVLSCPIYTQLIFTQAEVLVKILEQFRLYSKEERDMLTGTVNQNMLNIIENYNELTLSVLSDDGIISVLVDMVEIPAKHDIIKDLKQILSTVPLNENELKSFSDENGLESSKMGLENIEQITKPIASKWAVWPFDKYKEYLVYCFIGEKS